MKTKKYFGDKPLEGPVPFGSMYRTATSEAITESSNQSQNTSKFNNYNRNFSYPTPAELMEYERICKGSSSQIIAMLDKEQVYRQKTSTQSLNATILSKRIEVLLSFTLMMAIIAATVFLSNYGHIIPASITALSGIVSAMCIYRYNIKATEKPAHSNRFNSHKNNRHKK